MVYAITIKPHIHSPTHILFQNVISLEMSIGQYTLDNTCDGIDSYEIDIACLAETYTRWVHLRAKSTLRNTTKRHWNHSHIITSETEIPYKVLYKSGGEPS